MCGVLIYLCVCNVIFHICSLSTSPTLWRLLWKDWQEKARRQNWEPCAFKWSVQPPHLGYCIHVQSYAHFFSYLSYFCLLSIFCFVLPLALASLSLFSPLSSSPYFSSSSLLSFPAGDSCPVLQSLYVAWATGEDTFPRQHRGHYHPVFLTVDKGCWPLHGVGSVIMLSKRWIYTQITIKASNFMVPKHVQNFKIVTGVGYNRALWVVQCNQVLWVVQCNV